MKGLACEKVFDLFSVCCWLSRKQSPSTKKSSSFNKSRKTTNQTRKIQFLDSSKKLREKKEMKKFLICFAVFLGACCSSTSTNCQSPLFDSINGPVPICNSQLNYYSCETFQDMTWEEFSQFCFDNGERNPALDVQFVGSTESCWVCE